MKISVDRSKIPVFNRQFFDSTEEFTVIGDGEIGGKASGLALAHSILEELFPDNSFKGINVNIPKMTVVSSVIFDMFMKRNDLFEVAYSDAPDNIIAHEFQKATLPTDIVGDLRALITKVHSPLAIRSSSLLEDAMYEPFAGIYGTKMIPNNQFDVDMRYTRLAEAIKYVYASTFFKQAKDYAKGTGHDIRDEKMCVIIQEVVGLKHYEKFYPTISGVGRSYNFYPLNKAKPEDGIVELAVGLGRMIVDDGISWSYSPSYPRANLPYGSIKQLIDMTQRHLWCVNMGKPPAYDPMKETEYLLMLNIDDVEFDGTLNFTASTYDAESDRLYPGISRQGTRIINFASILDIGMLPLNELVKILLKSFEEKMEVPVEIEFAATFDDKLHEPRFGFLQVRPMVVSNEEVNITNDEIKSDRVILYSEHVLGNGELNGISDIVYVIPEKFDAKHSAKIAEQLEDINNSLRVQTRNYLLIGFGRWGSSDSWLGIPVKWGQISNAKVIVESMLQNMNVELSQGSHFFHNITSFNILYFSLKYSQNMQIDWNWIQDNETVIENEFVKHVRLKTPLLIKADGRKGEGIILK